MRSFLKIMSINHPLFVNGLEKQVVSLALKGYKWASFIKNLVGRVFFIVPTFSIMEKMTCSVPFLRKFIASAKIIYEDGISQT